MMYIKTHKSILVAFILNITFSIVELFGGIFTGSIAIISDSLHDFGDAISIGISYILEKISKKGANEKYTYGYIRYSVVGSLITIIILIAGSILVIYNAIGRIMHPIEINYNGMLLFAIFGILTNTLATYATKDGKSLNQKAVNLHMLEDVLGWVVVFIGTLLIKITNIDMIDPIMSILVSVFILIHAFKNLSRIGDVFLEKVPTNVNINNITKHLLEISEIKDIHHFHVWSMDGSSLYATLHAVGESVSHNQIKNKIRAELKEHGVSHVTIELESPQDVCCDKICNPHINQIAPHNHSH